MNWQNDSLLEKSKVDFIDYAASKMYVLNLKLLKIRESVGRFKVKKILIRTIAYLYDSTASIVCNIPIGDIHNYMVLLESPFLELRWSQ